MWWPFKNHDQFMEWMNHFRNASLILFLFLILFSCSCTAIKNYPQDNLVEEIVEEVIEYKTGLDIDLSPFSPEQKDKNPENLYQKMLEGKL